MAAGAPGEIAQRRAHGGLGLPVSVCEREAHGAGGQQDEERDEQAARRTAVAFGFHVHSP